MPQADPHLLPSARQARRPVPAAAMSMLPLLGLLFLILPSQAGRLLHLSSSSSSSSATALSSVESPAQVLPRLRVQFRRGVSHARAVSFSNLQAHHDTSSVAAVADPAPGGASSSASSSSSSSASAAGLKAWPGLGGAQAGLLRYHQGPLLVRPIPVHLVFYGDWSAGGQAVIEAFVRSLSSPASQAQGPSVQQWWRIMAPYTDKEGNTLNTQVVLAKSVTVGGSYKTQLGDGSGGGTNDIEKILLQLIQSGKLPSDSRAFYAVITSADVSVGDSVSGFCGSQGYCGWHTQTAVSETPIRYAFVGDGTEQCNFGCGHNAGLRQTPNGEYGADSLISTLAHELAEAASNPDTATGYWAQDEDGQSSWENGDLCNGEYTDDSFPSLQFDSRRTYAYNLEGVDGLKFLVQTNVDLEKQACVLQRSGAPSAESPPVIGRASPPPSVDASPPPPSLPDFLAPSPGSLDSAPLPASEGGDFGAPSPDILGGDSPIPDNFFSDPSWPEGAIVPTPNGGGNPGNDGAPFAPGFGGEVPSASPITDDPPTGDPACSGCDSHSCNTCGSPFGCRCRQGKCVPV